MLSSLFRRLQNNEIRKNVVQEAIEKWTTDLMLVGSNLPEGKLGLLCQQVCNCDDLNID